MASCVCFLFSHRYDVERAASPAPSYGSMHSDDWSGAVADNQCKIVLHRQDSSASSCGSSSCDEKPEEEPKQEEMWGKLFGFVHLIWLLFFRIKQMCFFFPFKLRTQEKPSGAPPPKPELLIDPNEKRHPALTVNFAFKVRDISSQLISSYVCELSCYMISYVFIVMAIWRSVINTL